MPKHSAHFRKDDPYSTAMSCTARPEILEHSEINYEPRAHNSNSNSDTDCNNVPLDDSSSEFKLACYEQMMSGVILPRPCQFQSTQPLTIELGNSHNRLTTSSYQLNCRCQWMSPRLKPAVCRVEQFNHLLCFLQTLGGVQRNVSWLSHDESYGIRWVNKLQSPATKGIHHWPCLGGTAGTTPLPVYLTTDELYSLQGYHVA